MEPIRDRRATLVDLLDRVLEKGLILNADIIISLAGVPLIAVCLRTAIASVETMMRHGMMADFISSQANPLPSNHRSVIPLKRPDSSTTYV